MQSEERPYRRSMFCSASTQYRRGLDQRHTCDLDEAVEQNSSYDLHFDAVFSHSHTMSDYSRRGTSRDGSHVECASIRTGSPSALSTSAR
jgi:hypothetical protein